MEHPDGWQDKSPPNAHSWMAPALQRYHPQMSRYDPIGIEQWQWSLQDCGCETTSTRATWPGYQWHCRGIACGVMAELKECMSHRDMNWVQRHAKMATLAAPRRSWLPLPG